MRRRFVRAETRRGFACRAPSATCRPEDKAPPMVAGSLRLAHPLRAFASSREPFPGQWGTQASPPKRNASASPREQTVFHPPQPAPRRLTYPPIRISAPTHPAFASGSVQDSRCREYARLNLLPRRGLGFHRLGRLCPPVCRGFVRVGSHAPIAGHPGGCFTVRFVTGRAACGASRMWRMAWIVIKRPRPSPN